MSRAGASGTVPVADGLNLDLASGTATARSSAPRQRCRRRVIIGSTGAVAAVLVLPMLLLHRSTSLLAFEAPGMPGQAPVRQRPLSGELEASSDEGAWVPDPAAYAAVRHRGGLEAREVRLFGWGELLGTWVEHLLTAIDVAVLGEHKPTIVALADRNAAQSMEQIELLRRFKRGVKSRIRVFVLYAHEFDWLFQAWEIKELPTLLLFGAGGAESRATVAGPLPPDAIAAVFMRQLAVDLGSARFEGESTEEGTLWTRLVDAMWRLAGF